MVLDDIPLFSMLKGRLGYLRQREKLVAENVANSDTPGYAPKDLKSFTFDDRVRAHAGGRSGGVSASPEAAAAMARSGGGVKHTTSYKPIAAPDSETTLDGNQVVLEEQMVKMYETRANYDAAIGFYQKSMNLLRMAARPPGR